MKALFTTRRPAAVLATGFATALLATSGLVAPQAHAAVTNAPAAVSSASTLSTFVEGKRTMLTPAKLYGNRSQYFEKSWNGSLILGIHSNYDRYGNTPRERRTWHFNVYNSDLTKKATAHTIRLNKAGAGESAFAFDVDANRVFYTQSLANSTKIYALSFDGTAWSEKLVGEVPQRENVGLVWNPYRDALGVFSADGENLKLTEFAQLTGRWSASPQNWNVMKQTSFRIQLPSDAVRSSVLHPSNIDFSRSHTMLEYGNDGSYLLAAGASYETADTALPLPVLSFSPTSGLVGFIGGTQPAAEDYTTYGYTALDRIDENTLVALGHTGNYEGTVQYFDYEGFLYDAEIKVGPTVKLGDNREFGAAVAVDKKTGIHYFLETNQKQVYAVKEGKVQSVHPVNMSGNDNITNTYVMEIDAQGNLILSTHSNKREYLQKFSLHTVTR